MQRTPQQLKIQDLFVGASTLIIVRIFLWLFYLDTPIPYGPISDSKLYFDIANHYLQTGSWTFHAALHSPLYPYFLATIFKLFGSSLIAVILIQNVIGVIWGCILLRWVQRLNFSRLSFFFCLLLLTTAGPVLSFEWRLFPVSLALFMQILCLHIAWSIARDNTVNVTKVLLLAINIGLLIVLRSNYLLILPIFWLWTVYVWRAKSWHKRYLAILTIPLLVLLPFMMRNHSLGAGYSLGANLGSTLLHGNHADADGGYVTPKGENPDIIASEQLRKSAKQPIGVQERAKVTRVLSFWRNQPIQTMQLKFKKLILLTSPIEIGGDIPFSYERSRSQAMQAVSRTTFSILLLLSLVGLRKQRELTAAHFPKVMYVGFAAVVVTTCLLFYVSTRYRLPLWPLLIFSATVGFSALRTSKKLFSIGSGFTLLALVILPGLAYKQSGKTLVQEDHNWAVALEHSNQKREAKEVYQEILRKDADHQPTLENLSRVFLQLGDNEKALVVLDHLLEIYPSSFIGYNNRSVYYLRHRNYQRAKQDAQRALQLNPLLRGAKENLRLANDQLQENHP